MFVCVALIPLVVSGALGYVESLRALEALVGSQTTLIAERIAAEVRDRRERLDANVALLAENEETREMLAAHAAGDPAADRVAIASARPYLLEVRAAMGGDAEWIVFRDARGRELLRLADTTQVASRDDGDRVVRMTRPLPSGAGSVVVGVPIAALLPPELLDARFGRSGYVVVVDRSTGRALHDPEHVDAITLARDGAPSSAPASAGSYVARYHDADSTWVATVVTLADP